MLASSPHAGDGPGQDPGIQLKYPTTEQICVYLQTPMIYLEGNWVKTRLRNQIQALLCNVDIIPSDPAAGPEADPTHRIPTNVDFADGFSKVEHRDPPCWISR